MSETDPQVRRVLVAYERLYQAYLALRLRTTIYLLGWAVTGTLLVLSVSR